ncbi:MAG: Crp/Fnr family transcriptional regulator [Desulfotignum sp.]|nr:Crp/Fnr family transcriptional regulator [Desulfotignum sp.]
MVPKDLLKKIQFLQDLPDDILEEIGPLAQVETFDPDVILVRQHQAQHLVYMLVAGKICLNTRSADGRILTLDEITPGRSVGVSALLGSAFATFTAVCTEPCEVITLSGDQMRKLFASDYTAGHAVMARVAHLFKDRMNKHTRQFLHSLSIHPAINSM